MGSKASTERSTQEGNSSSETQIEANKKDQIVKVAAAVAGVAVAAVAVASGFSSLLSGTEPEENKKMMKAPGQDKYIVREDFERDTATYFRNLRKGS